MAEKYGPFGLSYEDEERRLHNLELAKKYLEISGPSRNYERSKFSTDDGTMILTFALGDDPRTTDSIGISHKQLGEFYKAGASGVDCWPEWRLSNGTIYTTPDPDTIYIECDGQSMLFDRRLYKNDKELGYYLNHYLLTLTFKDGKLHNVTELYNTAAVYDNFGMNREPDMY